VTGVPISLQGAPIPPARMLTVPADLQERVQRLLRDPTAELLIWCGDPVCAYVDVHGNRRELEAERADRVVSPVERGGQFVAAIHHERVGSDDAGLVEQVAAAVGLEVERDRFLFELQRSERRSRALLEAIPDKMFRVRRDGIILDIQENLEHSTTPTDVSIGSSAYDVPVPREIVDRAMTAGRLALDTGKLQTIEWQRGVDGDLRHLEGRFIPSGDDEFIALVRDVTERKRHEVEQEALHRVALAVAAEGRPERIFDLVTEEAGRVLEAHSANLLRYDEDGAGSVIVGRWNEPGVYSGPIGHRFPMQDGTLAHSTYTTGLPVRLDLDDRTDADFANYMRRIGANSIVAAPITVTGRIWGVMTARLTPPHLFPAGAEERLGKFARLVSLALANEEAREQLAASRSRLLSTADEERRRLERNLHDGAQQRLVSLSLALRHAQRKLASDPESANELLLAASAELDVALEELRELARGIHPAVLTERGLEPALQTLAERSTVPVDIEVLADGRLPPRVEAAAYYLVSESLTNVAKYAGASCVRVRVAQDSGSAVVEVADDGIGGADPQRGSGLRGLMDRVEALDGELAVDSRPGEGTTIRATIPS
jgi:signal transduction histidine kinase/PAS domain-containing protein